MTRRLLLIVAAAVALVAWTSRPRTAKPLPRASRATKEAQTVAVQRDTLNAPSPDSVAVSGFEKPQRSGWESMFVTNHCARTMHGLALDITYSDMDGRMLHRASHTLGLDPPLPPGETRLVRIASFDRNGLFYYHKSPRAPRAAQATPFKVKVKVTYIVL